MILGSLGRSLGRFMGRLLDRLEEIMIAALMGVATLVVFAAVVHRYASGVSWLQPWTDLVDL